MVLAALAEHAPCVRPSLATVAERARCSYRAATNALDALEEAKLVETYELVDDEWRPRPPKGRRSRGRRRLGFVLHLPDQPPTLHPSGESAADAYSGDDAADESAPDAYSNRHDVPRKYSSRSTQVRKAGGPRTAAPLADARAASGDWQPADENVDEIVERIAYDVSLAELGAMDQNDNLKPATRRGLAKVVADVSSQYPHDPPDADVFVAAAEHMSQHWQPTKTMLARRFRAVLDGVILPRWETMNE
jgi:hypothetical protein